MDDFITKLKEFERKMHLLKQEIKELKAGKKDDFT